MTSRAFESRNMQATMAVVVVAGITLSVIFGLWTIGSKFSSQVNGVIVRRENAALLAMHLAELRSNTTELLQSIGAQPEHLTLLSSGELTNAFLADVCNQLTLRIGASCSFNQERLSPATSLYVTQVLVTGTLREIVSEIYGIVVPPLRFTNVTISPAEADGQVSVAASFGLTGAALEDS